MEERIKLLVEKLINKEQGYFDEFYELTKEKVFYSIFALLKNYTLSEDILQDTYLNFLSHIDLIDTNKSILGYLMTVSRNLALDYLRKNKKTVELDDKFYQIADNDKTKIKDEFLLENIQKILNSKEFEILILHIFNDMTFQEIAKHKKRPLGTILWSYNNSIKKLQRRLNYE